MTIYRTCVIDAPFVTRRAFEVGGPSAVIGATLATLARLQRDHDIAQIVFAWEARAGGAAFRRRISADYKAKRPAPDGVYHEACAELHERLPMLGAHQAWCEAEADDVAATITRQWPGPHLLYAADKDWLQFVATGVHMLKADCSQRPRDVPDHWQRPADKLITPANIVELTGLTADGWGEVLALAGDPVDGIPGLPKVGPKRARDIHAACPHLVRDLVRLPSLDLPEVIHRDLRALVAATEPSAARWVDVAIQHTEALRTSAALVRPYELPLEVIAPRPGDLDEIQRWLAGHGLEAMMRQLAPLVPADLDWDCPGPDNDLPF